MAGQPDWAALRRRFPIFDNWVHLETANKAAVALWVDEAAADFIADTRATGGKASFAFEPVEAARAVMARLLHVDPAELAFVKNTSEGLNIAAQGLGFTAGDNVVVAEDEHWSNIFPWRHLEADGVEVRWVRTRDRHGRMPIDAFTELMDSRTRAAAVSWVRYIDGYRADVSGLAEACRARGVVSVVDAIQAAGVLDIDIGASGIDVVACGGHKGLLGLNGSGFLYVRKGMLERIRPPFAGHMGFVPEQQKETPLEPWPDARRYEWGNPNFLGIQVMRRSAEEIMAIGPANIEARVRTLTDDLLEKARARQLAIRTPDDWAERAGIVTMELPGDPDATVDRLRDAGVIANVRGGSIRVSPHFYNTEDDIDRLLAAL